MSTLFVNKTVIFYQILDPSDLLIVFANSLVQNNSDKILGLFLTLMVFPDFFCKKLI